MFANGLFTNYALNLEIGTSYNSGTGEWTYSPLSEGIESIAEALNETVQQYYFHANQGFATNHVTGMAVAYTVTGKRVMGDAAQDYIFSLKYALNGERASSVRISWVDRSNTTHTITSDCTICNIQEFSGNANEDAAISFEIRFDGAPNVIPSGALPALVVVSVAGSTDGDTAIYVNPAIGDGNSYKYKTAASVTLPALGTVPGSGWGSWDGEAEITATTGNMIGIVEVDSDGKAVKGGLAVVTSA